MSWKLWLDDQHQDPETPARHAPEGFVSAGSTDEARELISRDGLPSFIDFDHDLGEQDTAMRFLRWLETTYPDGPVPDWAIHSANPVGAKNIESFLKSWRKSLE